jgi:hypothetical protein
MLATSISGRLFGGAVASASLALAALGFGIGAAAAAPLQPAPTDFGLPPVAPDPGPPLYDPESGLSDPGSGLSDPGSFLPAASGLPGGVGMPGSGVPGLSGIGGITPLIVDTTKLITAGSDPNALVSNAQSLLNDAGSLLGVPVGMPSLSSFVPSTGAPNVTAPVAPVPGLTPPPPLAPVAPGLPPVGPAL